MKNYHLYVASCENADCGGGIYHFALEDGEFSLRGVSPCDMPMYMDVEGSTLHTLLMHPFSGSPDSALTDFAIGRDGSLSPSGQLTDTMGVEACHLCHIGGTQYVANYMSGSIFALSPDGSKLLCQHHGSGHNALRQDAAHLHFVHPSPDGKFLLAVDLGSDTIYTCNSSLSTLSEAHVPSGHGCRHLAWNSHGSTVFCANELASTVTVFRYFSGRLHLVETVDSLKHPNPENTSAAIRTDGSLVYVSQRGEDAISVLEWKVDSLSLSDVYPCGGKSPRDFILLEDLLLSANQLSGGVSALRRQGNRLLPTGIRLDVPSPLCIVAVEM